MGYIGCTVSKWRPFKLPVLCALYRPHLPNDFNEILQGIYKITKWICQQKGFGSSFEMSWV